MSDDLIDQAVSDSKEPDKPTSVFEEYVGEGKTFKDPESLALGKKEADRFIDQLKDENSQMREALKEAEEKAARSTALSEVLDAVKGAASTEGDNQPPVSETDITQLVEQVINRDRQSQTAAANREQVNQSLLKHFNGDNAKAVEFVRAKQKDFQLDDNQLKALRDSSPSAFLTLLGVESTTRNAPSTPAHASADVNSGALILNSGAKKNLQYYNAKRKELGTAAFYSNLDLQNEMYREADKQGDSFFDE